MRNDFYENADGSITVLDRRNRVKYLLVENKQNKQILKNKLKILDIWGHEVVLDLGEVITETFFHEVMKK